MGDAYELGRPSLSPSPLTSPCPLHTSPCPLLTSAPSFTQKPRAESDEAPRSSPPRPPHSCLAAGQWGAAPSAAAGRGTSPQGPTPAAVPRVLGGWSQGARRAPRALPCCAVRPERRGADGMSRGVPGRHTGARSQGHERGRAAKARGDSRSCRPECTRDSRATSSRPLHCCPAVCWHTARNATGAPPTGGRAPG